MYGSRGPGPDDRLGAGEVARRAAERLLHAAGELAARLGYRSEAAFARAFKRVVGMPPGAVRRGAVG